MKTALSVRSFMRRRTLPKLFFSILLVSACYLLFAIISPARAQESSPSEVKYNTYTSANTFNTNPDVALNTHNAVQILFIEFLSTIHCQLTGVDPLNEKGKCLGVDRKTGKIGFVENGGGAISMMGRLIDLTLTPPASSMQYITYLKSNFGIVKNTQAQTVGQNPCIAGPDSQRGVGFCAIEPLLPIWVVMRNIVYLIFILVFVVVGLGIMLRVHIDPRTVMTLQNQIPKIIVGIVAITFSFAIAGLLIDIMWVAIYLFASVIISATGLDANATIKITQATDPFQAVDVGWGGVNEGFGIYNIANRTATAFSDIIEASLLQLDFGIIGNVIGGIIDVIATIILFIAILILLIRFFITLLLCFINIILDIIFAPFWILAGLFPGGPLGLGAWIRDLIANLAVFPVAIGFMLLGVYLMDAFTGTNSASDLSGLNFPMTGASANAGAIGVLIGFGFILMLPNLLNTLKAALKTPKINFGPLLGPVGAGVSGVRGIPGTTFSSIEKYRYSKGATGFQRLQGMFGSPLYASRPFVKKAETGAHIKGGGEGVGPKTSE